MNLVVNRKESCRVAGWMLLGGWALSLPWAVPYMYHGREGVFSSYGRASYRARSWQLAGSFFPWRVPWESLAGGRAVGRRAGSVHCEGRVKAGGESAGGFRP